MPAWPATAIVAVAPVLARAVVTTPSLSPELQASPAAETVRVVDEHVVDLVVGPGATFLGLASAAVLFAGDVPGTSARQS